MIETASIPLTYYIRTLNEAKHIGPGVEKVIELGAEVIVVDSGSSDGTREIAREAGAKVIQKSGQATASRCVTAKTPRMPIRFSTPPNLIFRFSVEFLR